MTFFMISLLSPLRITTTITISPFQVDWVTIYRVCGEIAVSRSIGDPDYKSFIPGEKVNAYFLWPETHDQVIII